MTTPETKCKKALKKFLSTMKEKHHKDMFVTALSDRYHSGLPDFMTVCEGITTFYECKAPKANLRPLQVHIAKQLILAGAVYVVARLTIVDFGDNILRMDELKMEDLNGPTKSTRKP